MIPADGRVFRHVVEDLARDVRAIIVDTAALARLEASAASATLRGALAGLFAGALLIVGGLFVLLGTAVLILMALGLPPWVAAALVSVALIGGGIALMWVCASQVTPGLLSMPRTRRSLRETLAWLADGAR